MRDPLNDYCFLCGDERIRYEKKPMTFDIRGETMVIDVPVKVCEGCGILEQDPDVDPCEIAFARYRAKWRLLTPEDIKRIRKSYGLSQKAFAALLGMSEATINRYEGGGLQDEAHDQAIRSCQHPDIMRDLLQRRRDRLSPKQRTSVEAVLNGPTHRPQGRQQRVITLDEPAGLYGKEARADDRASQED